MWLTSSYHTTVSSIECSIEPVRMLATVRHEERDAATDAIEKEGVEVERIPNYVGSEEMGVMLHGETSIVNPRDSFSRSTVHARTIRCSVTKR